MTLTINFVDLFRKVATDCDLDKSTLQYCLRRLRAEGLTFWTVTLPKLAKCILRSIEIGRFEHKISDNDALTCFAWKGRSLRYFRGLLGSIFSLQTGDLLPNPSASALSAVRQICEYVYKLALGANAQQKQIFEEKYEQNQRVVNSFTVDRSWREALRKNAETYYPGLYRVSPDRILRHGVRCGPGSFSSLDKDIWCDRGGYLPFYEWRAMPDDTVGTHDKFMGAYSGYFKPYPSAPVSIKPTTERRRAEVLFVPKDSRGPRVISKEPFHIIRPQMAFFAWCTSALSQLTAGRVQFLDQSINRALARRASMDKTLATLDLKDASDRIKFTLVQSIFRNSPGVLWFLRLCRSFAYRLPSNKRKNINSVQHALAGMGSGLTFPLLAFLVHLSICTLVSKTMRLPYKEVALRVHVYGDDVIVPSEWYQLACEALVRSGLEVNLGKSYLNGPFRESCGGDYLAGIECSPVRLKLANAGLPCASGRMLTINEHQCRGPLGDSRYNELVVALSRHCTELRKNGMFNTAKYLEDLLESRGIPMPWVGEGSPVLGRYTEDTRMIVMQGAPAESSSDIVGTVKCATYSAKTLKSSRLCPYKFLASKLTPSSGTTAIYELGNSSGLPFGEVAIPRSVKVQIKQLPVMALMPVSKEIIDIKLESKRKLRSHLGVFIFS